MATTSLFAELIVVGLGAFAWLALLVLTALGVDLVLIGKLLESPATVVPAFAVIYLLGIVTDRLADKLFHLARVQSKHEEKYPGFYADRAFVLAKSESCAQMYEYSRSRQRICRGWALNSLALLLSIDLFLLVRHSELPAYNWFAVGLVSSLLLAALAFACWQSWEAMNDTELARIKEQADVLRDIGA